MKARKPIVKTKTQALAWVAEEASELATAAARIVARGRQAHTERTRDAMLWNDLRKQHRDIAEAWAELERFL